MNVLVNGIGNIGKTILGVICDYKELFGIDDIYALKNTAVNDWNREDLLILKDKGVVICSKENPEFKPLDDIIDTIHYIFDCNANGIGIKNKNWYESLPNLKGCSAQGSEKGFGIPFMSSANNEVIENEQFVQIVSCNTHAISSLITTAVADDLSELIEGDFVVSIFLCLAGNRHYLVAVRDTFLYLHW
jgi:glyceraldehyde-3-phosphate dehydrogenase (NAD(P))